MVKINKQYSNLNITIETAIQTDKFFGVEKIMLMLYFYATNGNYKISTKSRFGVLKYNNKIFLYVNSLNKIQITKTFL